MAEEVLGVFSASEIWGLNRKRPCTLLLSDGRLLVLLDAEAGGRPRVRNAANAQGMDALADRAEYELALDRVRWVQLYPGLLSTLMKIQTAGGSYRFKVGRFASGRLEDRLRGLGLKVRRPGEY